MLKCDAILCFLLFILLHPAKCILMAMFGPFHKFVEIYLQEYRIVRSLIYFIVPTARVFIQFLLALIWCAWALYYSCTNYDFT